MLRYCAWCGVYQGHKPGQGHQMRADRCEIDTTTICSPCSDRLKAAAAPERAAPIYDRR